MFKNKYWIFSRCFSPLSTLWNSLPDNALGMLIRHEQVYNESIEYRVGLSKHIKV